MTICVDTPQGTEKGGLWPRGCPLGPEWRGLGGRNIHGIDRGDGFMVINVKTHPTGDFVYVRFMIRQLYLNEGVKKMILGTLNLLQPPWFEG